ncbi:MAG: hypothetical protein QXS85_01250 [Acidilobaceae archaeon]
MTGKIVVTTSRRPSRRSRSLVKDLVSVLPSATRFTRGHASMEDLARLALALSASRVVVVSERKGNPGFIRVYVPRAEPLSLELLSVFSLRGVKLAREVGSRAPSRPRALYVASDGSEASDRVAEELIKAFHAKLLVDEAPRDSIIASVSAHGSDLCLVRFFYGGRQVGPELRLSALFKQD